MDSHPVKSVHPEVVKPSTTESSTLAPEPPVVAPIQVAEPQVVVKSSDLLRKVEPKSTNLAKVLPFCLGFAYALFVFIPIDYVVGWKLGRSAGFACTVGYLIGAFYWMALFHMVGNRTGITVGLKKTLKQKKSDEEEGDPEAPPPAPVPVPDPDRPVAVTPVNPFIHSEDEQQYLRKAGEAEVAEHKKLLLQYGLFLLIAGILPLCGLFLWQTSGDPLTVAGCLIGYGVGICCYPICTVIGAKCRLQNFFWAYKEAVVAQSNAKAKAASEGKEGPMNVVNTSPPSPNEP